LLRSPKASEGSGGALGEATAKERGNMVGLRDQIKDLVNLPTPTVSDQYTANLTSTQQSEGSLHSVTFAQIVNRADLMPTPAARDYKDGQTPHERNGVIQTDTIARAVFNSGEVKLLPTPLVDDSKNTGHNKTRITTLASETYQMTTWGRFEPAIRRWETVLQRPAPAPTNPDGKDGNHRLSSKFTEWMMGLPEGWITDAGLTRNEELKACGNGVVPQQAELALRMLLK
jgi:hypothetical protein